MTDAELRIECLKLAERACDHPSEVVPKADEIYRFAKGKHAADKAVYLAALDLYDAGKWEITNRFMPAEDQAVMWERLRDALGLKAGHATDAGGHGRRCGEVDDT